MVFAFLLNMCFLPTVLDACPSREPWFSYSAVELSVITHSSGANSCSTVPKMRTIHHFTPGQVSARVMNPDLSEQLPETNDVLSNINPILHESYETFPIIECFATNQLHSTSSFYSPSFAQLLSIRPLTCKTTSLNGQRRPNSLLGRRTTVPPVRTIRTGRQRGVHEHLHRCHYRQGWTRASQRRPSWEPRFRRGGTALPMHSQ